MAQLFKQRVRRQRIAKSEVPVFLVDDDPLYLHVLKEKLKKYPNVRLYSYRSGEDCLQYLHLNPRVVILDYYLDPGSMNGIEILKQIKQLNPATEVIVLSSQDTLQVVADSLGSGAFAYLIKDSQVFVSIGKLLKTLSGGETGQKDN